MPNHQLVFILLRNYLLELTVLYLQKSEIPDEAVKCLFNLTFIISFLPKRKRFEESLTLPDKMKKYKFSSDKCPDVEVWVA
jgi:hypothetical protein